MGLGHGHRVAWCDSVCEIQEVGLRGRFFVLYLNFVNSSMKSSKTSMDSLIAAGLIGASLGAFLSNDKEEGAVIGAILGAAISATAKASIEARKTQLPQMVEEHGALYEIDVNGEKRLVKNLNKTSRLLPDQFQLI
jgi:hypothetical protein